MDDAAPTSLTRNAASRPLPRQERFSQAGAADVGQPEKSVGTHIRQRPAPYGCDSDCTYSRPNSRPQPYLQAASPFPGRQAIPRHDFQTIRQVYSFGIHRHGS